MRFQRFTMDWKEEIDELLRRQGSFVSGDLQKATGTTRQAVQKHLQGLVQNGSLVVEGLGKATRYASSIRGEYSAVIKIARAEEDLVWKKARSKLPGLADRTSSIAARALEYAFTEML